MNIILAEDRNYPLGSFVIGVRDQFPASSTITLHNKNIREVRKALKTPPLYTAGWLVLSYLRSIDENLVQEFNSEDNVLVYVVRNNDDLEEFKRVFLSSGLSFSVVDNLHPDKETIREYIRKTLGVKPSLAKFIAARHNYYLPMIYESVEILKSLQPVTKKVVTSYTRPSSSISFNGLFDYIIGVDTKRSYSECVELVHSYRFGLDFLIKFIVNRFKSYLFLYERIIEGSLSLDNYQEYYEKNRTNLKDVNIYTIKKVLQAFSEVSYDKLWFLACLYERELEHGCSVSAVLSLLRLSEK